MQNCQMLSHSMKTVLSRWVVEMKERNTIMKLYNAATVLSGKACKRWSGAAAMKWVSSSSVSSDLALPCRYGPLELGNRPV